MSEETKRKISIANKKAWEDESLRERVSLGRAGKRNPNWSCDGISYSGIHKWLVSTYGSADRCENLLCENSISMYDWALLRGKEYKRNRSSFIKLCRKCHNNYDKNKLYKIKLPTDQK